MTVTAPPPANTTLPGPPWIATPNLLRRMAKDRLDVMTSVSRRYGDAVKLRLGPKQMLFFNHPDHAKHILADNPGGYLKGIGLVHARKALGDGLLTSEGEVWKRQRKVIQPAFQAKRIAAKTEVIAEEAAAMVERLRRRAGGAPIDMRAEMTELTLGVLGRALLETDLGVFENIGDSFEAVQDQAIFEMMTLSSVPRWIPLPKQLKFRKGRAELDRIVARLTADRSANPTETGVDILSRLIAQAGDDHNSPAALAQIRDEMVTLLLAGHETTASTLSWTFHLLSGHPEVWERLHEEAVSVLGDGPITYEHLHGLSYTSMVIQEVMRLYPAVWLLPREAKEDDVVGGYHVPAGSDVLLCPYTLHRHPDFWDRPDEFDPDRFDTKRAATRHRYAYIPFGAGPRVCVGSSLGLIEATVVTASIARALKLTTVPGYEVRGEPMLTLRVRGGLPMTVAEA